MLVHLSHYLHSNQAPSEDEAREIKALKVKPLEEISMIDAEIERIETILDSLKRKRADIQRSIDDCDTILSPVRRLPMDIWGVIFTHCLTTHRNSIMDPSEAPILLTHICHDWRSIALSTPRLWSRFYIPPSIRPHIGNWGGCENLQRIRDGERRMEVRAEEVQRWLRLSGACPLSITMQTADGLVPQRQVLDQIIQSSRRWQQLELPQLLGILSSDSDVYMRILSLSADDLRMLRELRCHEMSSFTNAAPWPQSGLLTAQGLRRISIGRINPTTMFSTGIPPNWKNLNRLFIHCPVGPELVNQILSYCCNLVRCALIIDRMQWSFFHASVSITFSSYLLPHLELLSIHGPPTACSQLFRNINTPSLRILYGRGEFPSEHKGSGLFNFLQSINSLETFIIDYRNNTRDDALKCCTLIPSLTHLVLGQTPADHFTPTSARLDRSKLISDLVEIRHQYTPGSAPTVLLPLLEVFEAYDIPTVTDDILLRFITTRIDAARSNTCVAKLRKVLVQFSRTKQKDIVPEALAYARAAGIELELNLSYSVTEEAPPKLRPPSYGLSEDSFWTYPTYDCY